MRGKLTEQIEKKSEELLGYKITQAELRLMPYIQFVMMNDQVIDPRKINPEERKILSDWREKELIEGGAGGLDICKDFWIALNEICWIGYVAHEGDL